MKVHKSGWPSGLRRQPQGTPSLLIAEAYENSGPLMRAWVRIPLLTKYFLLNVDNCNLNCCSIATRIFLRFHYHLRVTSFYIGVIDEYFQRILITEILTQPEIYLLAYRDKRVGGILNELSQYTYQNIS